MPKIAMLNQEGAKVGEIELSEAIFASEINESVLHLVVRSQLAAKRQGTQSALKIWESKVYSFHALIKRTIC